MCVCECAHECIYVKGGVGGGHQFPAEMPCNDVNGRSRE